MLRKQSVQVNIDNSSACRILPAGRAKPYLRDIAIDVFNFCSKFNIKLIPSGSQENKTNQHMIIAE